MIYTVTFNPSIDYIIAVDDFKVGMTNRTAFELMLPGGKGINISVVLSNLGIPNTAIYFAAGFIGDEITAKIRKLGIIADAIEVKEGCSRINVKLKSIDGTEINGMGPVIGVAEMDALGNKLSALKEGDILCLAGSIPAGMPKTVYSDIAAALEGRGIRLVVDATKDLLTNVLKYRPFLIKPNNHEIEEIFGAECKTRESVLPYAKKLREMGARNVLVSLAEEGAVLLDENDKVYMAPAPKGHLKNGVGAGDSMTAGFLTGYLNSGDYGEAFRMGLAAGSASAFSDYLATKEEVMKLFREMNNKTGTKNITEGE